jgi:hypothetical protein
MLCGAARPAIGAVKHEADDSRRGHEEGVARKSMVGEDDGDSLSEGC